MEARAIDFGVSIFDFWEMTLRETIETAASGKRRRVAELKEKAEFDYKAAQLNAYAFNDPKHMPKKEDHYSFLKDFKNIEVEFVDEGVKKPKLVSEPEKPKWMIHKEIMMETVMSMNAKINEKKREEGGEQ